MDKFNEQCTLWAEVRLCGDAAQAEAHYAKLAADRLDAAAFAALDELPGLHKRLLKLSTASSFAKLWRHACRHAADQIQSLERMVQQRRRARAEAREVQFGPSMVAERVGEPWAAVVRRERLEGIDVMDFTMDDARSCGVDDPDGLCRAVWQLRDELTRPVAELVRLLHARDDPVADWHEAQTLLKALFAQGLADPAEARLARAHDVATRFRCHRDARTLSVANALHAALQ